MVSPQQHHINHLTKSLALHKKSPRRCLPKKQDLPEREDLDSVALEEQRELQALLLRQETLNHSRRVNEKIVIEDSTATGGLSPKEREHQ